MITSLQETDTSRHNQDFQTYKRNNRGFDNRFDMHGMGYRDMPLGRGMPPTRDMFFHEGYVEQGIARELRQFRNLPPPLPPLPPVPEFYDNRSLPLGREYYPERMHDRSRDLDYGRERNLDYGYRERGGERGWDRERDYYDDRDSRRDYDNYRDKDYERDRDYARDRDRDWDRDRRDYERRDRDREPERDRDRDRDWDRQRSSRDDRPKDEPRQKKERISRWDDSYDKEKEKERRRERDREKERDRDRDRDERDRDRDRDRDERDRDRDRDRDERERDRDRDRDRERDRGRDRDRRSETDDSEFKSENDPTSVIMLRGLRDEIKEDDILQELYDAEVAFKDVRIVRNKIGYTRGFGFVEFDDIESAKQWMNLIKGRLLVQGYSISADYSRPKSNQDKDWNCTKCGTQNFSSRRRTTCFSCGTLKEISTGSEDKESSTSGTPCKVIILKGLDVLTNEENVRTVLSSVTSLPIFDIRLIRDKLTNTSRGFCFVELASIEDATTLLKMLQEMNPPFEIDGRLVCTSYAKTSEPAPTTKPSNVATAAIEQAQWSSSAMQPKQSSAAAMAIAQAQAASQTAYSTPYQQQMPMAVSNSNTTDSSSSSFTSTSTAQASVTSATQQSALYGNPHASNFVYDPMSGYYYDATSGLYYDSITQYYYNGTTGQYFYWDGVTQQYVPVTSNGSASTALTTASTVPTVVTAASTTVVSTTATTTTTETSTTASNEALDSLAAKEKQKKAKSLQAKKIAKDMERWAKNVNAAKAQQHHQPADTLKKPAQMEEPEFKKPTLPPPKLLTVLNKSFMNIADEPQTQEMVRSSPLSGLAAASKKEEAASPGKWSSIVAEYGEDDDSDPEPDEPSDNKFADLKLMACLLCKRQFPNKEGLDRHMQFSDLHKQNLEIHKKMSMTEKQLEEYERKEREAKYRDRAKERREKYNQPDIGPTFSQPPSRKRKGFQPTSKFEQPTKEGIGEDNIGNKMLRAMGWSQGSGLGKSGQGIVDPIKAQMRTQYAGLGSAGSSYGSVTGAESPGEKRRKLAMNRYNDL